MNFNDIFKSSFLENISSVSILDMAVALALAFGLGMFIFLVYKKTYQGVMYSSSFGTTLVALTMITTVVILAVTSNVVLSLGMVGALSIVRFRTAIKVNVDPVTFYGVNNSNIQLIRNLFPKLRMAARGSVITVIGDDSETADFEQKIHALADYCAQYNTLPEDVIIDTIKGAPPKQLKMDDVIVYGVNGKPISGRTPNQQLLVQKFAENDLTFALGPAGTGKTYLAVALAVRSLKNREARKIILSRPAVEAGEKLGFLPGDMKDKIDPYLQPLYDALEDMIPQAKLKEYMENNVIQIAPLAFMRGRTLNDAIIVLDEAQNTTTHQIKMFLTRLGMGSKMIVTGDTTQIDLPRSTTSGLIHALRVLDGVRGIGKVEFEKKDIVRHQLVQRIVEAYERFHEEEKLFVQDRKEDEKA